MFPVSPSPIASQKFCYDIQNGTDAIRIGAITTKGGIPAALVTSTTDRNNTEIAMKLDGSRKRTRNIANAKANDNNTRLGVSCRATGTKNPATQSVILVS